jgi:hypothetical protein
VGRGAVGALADGDPLLKGVEPLAEVDKYCRMVFASGIVGALLNSERCRSYS